MLTFEDFKAECVAKGTQAPSCKGWSLHFNEVVEESGKRFWYVTARVQIIRTGSPMTFGPTIEQPAAEALLSNVPWILAQLGRIIEDERTGEAAASEMYKRILGELGQPQPQGPRR